MFSTGKCAWYHDVMLSNAPSWIRVGAVIFGFLLAIWASDRVVDLLHFGYFNSVVTGVPVFVTLLSVLTWFEIRLGLVRWIPARSRDKR